jgi:hypothetical protein
MTNLEKNILRFVQMVEVLDFQRPTFHYNLKGNVKMQFNNFYVQLKSIRSTLHRHFNQEANEFLDNRAALIWEILDEVDKAVDNGHDPRMILAIAQSFNAGEIKLAGRGNHAPINKMKLEELKAKAA